MSTQGVSLKVGYTYQDYLKLPDDGKRYQIIQGKLFMAPAPSPYHQRISERIGFILGVFARKTRLGEVFYAPCDVVLSERDVVQPDILFIFRERYHIIGEHYIGGAPDLVVEILSPATRTLDREHKRRLYERHGVKEMWIVDPEMKEIEVLRLVGERFVLHGRYGRDDLLESPLLEGLSFRVNEIF